MGIDLTYIVGNDGRAEGDPAQEKTVYTMRTVELDAYDISKFPITVRQYRDFSEQTGYHQFPGPTENDFSGMNKDICPVTCSYFDALAYCYWYGALHHETVRLPTEAEWEIAATGGRGQKYPWGDKYRPVFKGYHPVGDVKEDISPYGVSDTFSNWDEIFLDLFDSAAYARTANSNPLSLHSSVSASSSGKGPPFDFAATGRSIFNAYDFPLGMMGIRTPAIENSAFRIVREKRGMPTLFNKGSDFEAVWTLQPCRTKIQTPLYSDPAFHEESPACPSSAQGWLLFESRRFPGSVFIIMNCSEDSGLSRNSSSIRIYYGWTDKSSLEKLKTMPNWQ